MELDEIIIKEIVELGYDFTSYNNSRKREHLYARWIYFKLAREFTSFTLDEIGKKVGKEHAGVIHGLKNFQQLKMYEPVFYKRYLNIRQVLLKPKPKPKDYYEVLKWHGCIE